MPWIAHVMVVDDDPRVLESLVPSLLHDLARGLGKSKAAAEALRRGDGNAVSSAPLQVKLSAHGFESDRLGSYRYRAPHQVHVHLVREAGGRFDLARRLLNEQLFAAVVSDLRFSDDARGQRAGQLFVDEVVRVHPEVRGLLYSAYPKPDGFPAERFIRKGGEVSGEPSLADAVVTAINDHLAEPAVSAFVRAIADQGLIYQSDAFGTTLAQVFGLARLMGVAANAPSAGRGRRSLPCVLLDGESGTGKRGLAALFHAASDRRKSPVAVASCNELTNETLLRSILFGHKRGAFTDAREDRPGLVASAGKGTLLLDDFHRLSPSCSAVLHSFLEDGEYSRLGEEEVRRHADCAAVLTVETGPWAERRRSGELPLAFLARVERLPITIPPLRERPEDIEAQARWLARTTGAELGADIELSDEALANLKLQPLAESNSRELRNAIERAIYGHYRETDQIEWAHIRPFLGSNAASPPATRRSPTSATSSAPAPNEWQRRLRALATRILGKGLNVPPTEAEALVTRLFDDAFPQTWPAFETARQRGDGEGTIPLPVWEDAWRCFAVSWLGGPAPAEKVLGIPANTLRQWINDRESR
jgi:transcriptional regulator with AAA-type ATPase domain